MNNYPENADWKATLDEMAVRYRQRTVSGALIALCVFHDEKSPSMWMYPDRNFYCYGCGVGGTSEEFLERLFPGQVDNEDFDLRQATIDMRVAAYARWQHFTDLMKDGPPF